MAERARIDVNRSLAKALATLEALAASPRGLTALELGRTLRLPRATVYRILGTLGEHRYVERGDGNSLRRRRVGASLPMHTPAPGKAVLAFLPATRVDAILAQHGMPRRTPRTIVSRPALERGLARVRRQGFALDNLENEGGGRSAR